MAVEAKAIARYVRVSPQKARLVVDLIRGRKAEEAVHLLQFTQKRVAADVAKLLQSAIANASDRELGLDVDALYVTWAVVNDGPRQKRIRPAPMGRAYRYQRRTSHIELRVGERPSKAGQAVAGPAAAAAPAAAKKPAAPKPRVKAKLRTGAKTAAKPTWSKSAAPKTPRAPSRKGGSKNKGGE